MRKIVLLLMLTLLVTSWTGLYAASAAIAPKQAVQSYGGLELSQVRWANHTEALTGAAKLRLVMDVSGPVKASGVVVNAPTPRLVVTVKGTTPGTGVSDLTLDGKVVEKVSFDVNGKDTTVTFDLPLKVEAGDYKVFTLPSDAKANRPFRVVVDINKPLGLPDFSFTAGLKDKVIAIDPGHGGSDPGAIGPTRYQEKTATLAVAQNVQDLLEKAGARVIMTRQDDRDVFGPDASDVEELKARSSVGNNRKADIFLSIHADSFSNPAAGGTTTYYYQKTLYDSMLAEALQTSLVEAGDLQDRGARTANFYVIKRTQMPAALVELAFISNPNEEKLLSSPGFQQKMALGIVRGLERFFDQAAKLN
ncbi:N-acetylmuramoyl-L-alanine amidase [Sporomusa sp. KB1]|nr:N-acetylmuramoyl-L-alanine amidase [Sporomusa sp. KB1]TWH47785.1 N-acetylmuramoyl-L-alanine amidase [Sporomusa sp. KB1]